MKKLFSMVLAAAAMTAAKADYIYAMIQDAHYDYNGTPVSFKYVKVSADGTYMDFYTSGSDTPLSQMYAADSSHPTYSLGAYGDDPEGFFVGYDGSTSYTTFLFELWTQTGDYATLLGKQEVSLAALQAAGAVTSGTSASGDKAYRISSVAVPEPTGGMLILLGMAVMALKRKLKVESGATRS